MDILYLFHFTWVYECAYVVLMFLNMYVSAVIATDIKKKFFFETQSW